MNSYAGEPLCSPGPICDLSILQDIPWVITDAVATRAYMPERATKDLDILVHHRDGAEVLTRLKEAGYQFVSNLTIPGFLLHSPDGTSLTNDQ